jgi:hypothetical protein
MLHQATELAARTTWRCGSPPRTATRHSAATRSRQRRRTSTSSSPSNGSTTARCICWVVRLLPPYARARPLTLQGRAPSPRNERFRGRVLLAGFGGSTEPRLTRSLTRRRTPSGSDTVRSHKADVEVWNRGQRYCRTPSRRTRCWGDLLAPTRWRRPAYGAGSAAGGCRSPNSHTAHRCCASHISDSGPASSRE